MQGQRSFEFRPQSTDSCNTGASPFLPREVQDYRETQEERVAGYAVLN